jgi:hypothetical protein
MVFSFLIFVVPVLIFLGVQAWAAWERNSPRDPAGGRVARPPRRKAKSRPASSTGDCGRAGTHLLLTLAGARSSCRHCAGLPPTSDIDAVAEAERIISEAKE